MNDCSNSNTSNYSNCSICLNNENNNFISLTTCMHSFCKECITEWIRSGKTTCPNCRSIITITDYNNCNIKYRCDVLQEFISNAIEYNSEKLITLDQEYTDLLISLDTDDSVAELVILVGERSLNNLMNKNNEIMKRRTKTINNYIRLFTQDDLDIISEMTDYSDFHNLILTNFNEIQEFIEESKKYSLIINNQFEIDRSERKRKREYNEMLYIEQKNNIINHINLLKET